MEPGNSRNAAHTSGYSAEVDLQLRVNGCLFAATHVGGDRVILAEAAKLPDGPAEVIVTVDGVEDRFPVLIENRDRVRQVVPVRLIGTCGSPGA